MIEQRVFEDELGIFGQYPFSRHLRLEGGASASLYSFRVDSINNYYVGNRLVDREEYRAESPESFFMFRTYLAYVGDRSQFGLTSPMSGYRYRIRLLSYKMKYRKPFIAVSIDPDKGQSRIMA